VCENILGAVDNFVSNFSAELFPSKLFLLAQGFTRTISNTGLLTYTSVVHVFSYCLLHQNY